MSNQDTRNLGLKHVYSVLSQKNWKYKVIKQGRTELHRIARNDTYYTIQIRILSKEDPVPFPQGLNILDSIDYLVICYNLAEQPKIIVLEPITIREIIHKDSKNEDTYWLQPKHYNKHGVSFEQIFG